MDYVIFPMNIAETHWSMGAIDMREKGFPLLRLDVQCLHCIGLLFIAR